MAEQVSSMFQSHGLHPSSLRRKKQLFNQPNRFYYL